MQTVTESDAKTHQALMSASGVQKRFAGTHALKGVDFSLKQGEVHALIGANGAGKSTLSRILAGLMTPDSGEIFLNGQKVRFSAPREAMDAGVTLVTQETSLAPHLSALENIFLPELRNPGSLNWRKLRGRAEQLIDELGLEVGFSLDDETRDLSMANRQVVEILKVLAQNSKVIFLDEPTTSLSPFECDRLLALCKTLASKGHGLVLVTHRMEEIFSFTDRLTVLREGNLIKGGVETASLSSDDLIQLMVGRQLHDLYASGALPSVRKAATVFAAERLQVGNVVRDVSFSVQEGEILGLGGLVGAGRTETVEAIFGLRPLASGKMTFRGEPFSPRNPKDAIRAGMGFIGEDRRRQGLIPDVDVRENLLLVHLSLSDGMLASYSNVMDRATQVSEQLGLSPARLRDPDILKFSGGMQQKVIIARWLLSKPDLLILDEPTRGVDIETRSSIYKALREIASQGSAVIVVSSDFEELLGISDRVIVLSDGRSVAEAQAADLSVESLTMIAAPRSSAEMVHQLLVDTAQRFQSSVAWVHKDGDNWFCFESAAPGDAQPDLTRGRFYAVSDPAAPDPARGWILAPLSGRHGQDLGLIALQANDPGRAPTEDELQDHIRHILHTTHHSIEEEA